MYMIRLHTKLHVVFFNDSFINATKTTTKYKFHVTVNLLFQFIQEKTPLQKFHIFHPTSSRVRHIFITDYKKVKIMLLEWLPVALWALRSYKISLNSVPCFRKLKKWHT